MPPKKKRPKSTTPGNTPSCETTSPAKRRKQTTSASVDIAKQVNNAIQLALPKITQAVLSAMNNKSEEHTDQAPEVSQELPSTATEPLSQAGDGNSFSTKTWLFAVSGNRRPWNFIGSDGVLKGADLDLIQAVCSIANQKCATTLAPTEACVQTIRGRFYPGEGLMGRWFDACTGYVSSVDRVNALQFTNAIRTTTSTFTVLKGNPKKFDPEALQNAVIVHLNGAFTNEQCTIRIGLGKPKQVIVASGIVEAKELLLNQTADALFSPRTNFNDLEVLPGRYRCDISGVGMMVRKDSDLPAWWNTAFEEYYLSGAYNNACDQINQKYGGFPVRNCLPRPPAGKPRVGSTGSGQNRKRKNHLVVYFRRNNK